MPNEEVFLNGLRQAGMRITAQRRAICAYLAATASHPTPYDVYQAVTDSHPGISRATVYNTLNTLQQLGLIVEISFGSEHTHYDTDPEPHINIICLRCHTIQDYYGDVSLDRLYEDVQHSFDFQPVAAKIDIVGFCPSCRAQRRAEIVAQWSERHPTPARRPDDAADSSHFITHPHEDQSL
jgi:Fur family peroxide stress response transcriptional regulator